MKYFILLVVISLSFSSYGHDFKEKNDVFLPKIDDNSIIDALIYDKSVELFYNSSIEDMDSYLNDVIILDQKSISFKYKISRVLVDLKLIINDNLQKYCSDRNVVFSRFSPIFVEKMISLDKGADSSNEDLELRVFELKTQLNLELEYFILYNLDSEIAAISKNANLRAIDPVSLPFLNDPMPPLRDPRTGLPLLEDENLGERIVSLLESNNKLIEILTGQFVELKEDMHAMKEEEKANKKDIAYLSKRMDMIEQSIRDLKNGDVSDTTVSSDAISHSDGLKESDLYEKVIYYDKNSIKIDSEYHSMLNKAASQLKSNPTLRVMITGYADKSGNIELNARISKSRALAVRRYLVNKGIDKDRMSVNYLGDLKSKSEALLDRKVVIKWFVEK